MGKLLPEILEIQFNLLYYLHLSISDFDNTDLKDLDWMYNRLVKQKRDEKENAQNIR